ncbi:MAG: hypothetical protein AMJ88_15310 [Anaerolineae bacterium SM23_ 63]|nr:MAG: hypothetical protein AMJ88_15310 [Anaerolineae bacterium SM23_ 63]
MDIAAIFKRAWEITWKHKGLWVLGFLANCSGGGSQGSSNISRIPEYKIGGGEFPEIERWFQSVPDETWIIIGIAVVCGLLLLALLFWVLAAIGNGGLIAGFQMAETGESVTLGSAFQQGISYFWKLLVIQLIIGLASLLVFGSGIIGGVLFSILTLGLGLICLIPFICLLVPIGIAISIYTLLTQIALIVEELDIGAAFRRAWEIFRSNPGQIILMGLILGVGGFVVGLILAIPFVLMALPFVAGLVMGTDTSSLTGLTMTMIGILLYLPVLLIAGAIMRTFITGSWTLTYRDLIKAKTA